MVFDRPTVEWTFDVKDVQAWATTLGECIHTVPANHRPCIREIILSLETMMIKHQRQHEEVVTEAPTIEDLMDYLASYAKHV